MTSDLNKSMNGLAVEGPKAFGKSLRESDFLFDKTFLNLNHASFGTYPIAVRNELRKYQDASEARPDEFIRYIYPGLLDESRSALADMLHCDAATITLVPNTTTGVNIVLANLAPTWTANDRIVYFSHAYGSCEKIILWACETYAVKPARIVLTYPVSDEEIVKMFKDKIVELEQKGHRVVLALFDTIISMPGIRMPFESMIKVCKQHNVYSLVDGAHGIGQLKLDLQNLDPDFFLSNCHKWLFVPRGCAVMYVPLRNQKFIRTALPTSHHFAPQATLDGEPIINPLPASRKSPYLLSFEFTGTIDNSPYLCIPAAIKYRRDVLGGEDRIREYCQNLAKEAAAMVRQRFGTESLEEPSTESRSCFLFNVRLPITRDDIESLCASKGAEFSPFGFRDWYQARLMRECSTFVPIFWYGGAWWARLAAMVYLDLPDFEVGVEQMLQVCEEARAGLFLS